MAYFPLLFIFLSFHLFLFCFYLSLFFLPFKTFLSIFPQHDSPWVAHVLQTAVDEVTLHWNIVCLRTLAVENNY